MRETKPYWKWKKPTEKGLKKTTEKTEKNTTEKKKEQNLLKKKERRKKPSGNEEKPSETEE